MFGAQYFAHARYSAQFFYLPVSATLFHHAIEMLLKGYLVEHKTLNELKILGHNLKKLWNEFKNYNDNLDLAHFDKAIMQLDKVELLRYPDSIVEDGFILQVGTGNYIAPMDIPGMDETPRYTVRISDLDNIATKIFKACNVAPEPHFQSAPTEFLKALPPSLWKKGN